MNGKTHAQYETRRDLGPAEAAGSNIIDINNYFTGAPLWRRD